MKKLIYLKINTYDGVITIPFKSLEDVDFFTVMYDNMGSLVTSLIKLLKLPIDLYDVRSVYLTSYKYNMGFDEKCMPIKYSYNNFDFVSLKEAFLNYLKNDPKRIRLSSLRYDNIDSILRSLEIGKMDYCALEAAVRKYFEQGTGYKRRRDTYFLIINTYDAKEEKNVKIVINPVEYKNSTNVDKNNLSIYSTGEDNHLNNLIELYRRNPELRDKIMDEIAQSGSEEIIKYLHNDEYGIIDGVSRKTDLMKVKRAALEETTGMSIDDLRSKYVFFNKHSNSSEKRRPR